jgi:predicted  nucleic acid-binding Zn-ribbon protein
MKTLAEIRTVGSLKRNSRTRSAKPKKPSQNFLDMYVLTTEKERLEKELRIIDRRRLELMMRIADVTRDVQLIGKKIDTMRKSGDITSEEFTRLEAQLKKFSLNY